MGPIRTRIEIRRGMILCMPHEGHLRVRQGTQLEWVSADEEFTLSFMLLGGRSAWPFQERQPSQFNPTHAFRGTLLEVATGGEPPAYKYTVRIGGKLLDPIIIVDR